MFEDREELVQWLGGDTYNNTIFEDWVDLVELLAGDI